MKTFVVAAFLCAVAHLSQGGELAQKNHQKRGIYGGVADIHDNGVYLGSGDLSGHLGVGIGGVGGYNKGYYGYGENNYGYADSATSYSSGIVRGVGHPWANKYGNVGAGYYGNLGANQGYYGNLYGANKHGDVGASYYENHDGYGYGPYASGYKGAGISHTERYDGYGAGYSKTSHKLANGASTYSKISYGGSKYYY